MRQIIDRGAHDWKLDLRNGIEMVGKAATLVKLTKPLSVIRGRSGTRDRLQIRKCRQLSASYKIAIFLQMWIPAMLSLRSPVYGLTPNATHAAIRHCTYTQYREADYSHPATVGCGLSRRP